MSGTTTWDTVQKASNVTLSGSNLIATLSNTTQGGVRSTRQNNQPIYVESTCTLVGTTYRFGLALPQFGMTGSTVLGVDTSGVAINAADGTVKINNVTIGTVVSFTTADTIDMAYNPQLRLIWFRKNNGSWNNVGGADPGSATLSNTQSGFDTSTLASGGGGGLFVAFSSGGTSSAAITAKFSTAFTRTAPTGYASVDADPGNIGKASVLANGTANVTGSAAVFTPDLATGPICSLPGNHSTAFRGGWYGANNTPNTKTVPFTPPGNTVASGFVYVLGAAAAKKVRLYDQGTGQFLGETTSSAVDGSWSIPAMGHTSVYAVCLDDTGTYDALVFDLVVPL